MFAGKTSRMIAIRDSETASGRGVIYVKHALDVRYDNGLDVVVTSHDGIRRAAVTLSFLALVFELVETMH
jgi:thymidine kinase